MSIVIRLNDEQIKAVNSAVRREIDRTGVGKSPKDVHIRYLGALIQVRDKLKSKEEIR